MGKRPAVCRISRSPIDSSAAMTSPPTGRHISSRLARRTLRQLPVPRTSQRHHSRLISIQYSAAASPQRDHRCSGVRAERTPPIPHAMHMDFTGIPCGSSAGDASAKFRATWAPTPWKSRQLIEVALQVAAEFFDALVACSNRLRLGPWNRAGADQFIDSSPTDASHCLPACAPPRHSRRHVPSASLFHVLDWR